MSGLSRTKSSRIYKFVSKVEDIGEGRIRAVVSTETQDRDGDIIRQAGWDLRRFQKHPILLVDHNYADITKEIGKWETMKIDGDVMIGEARYFIGKGNETADWAYFLAASENMAAFSVGFLPDWAKAKELDGGDEMWPHYEFNGQELLEVSQVTVPSNPEALQLALHTKTLMPSVRVKIEQLLSDFTPPEELPDGVLPPESSEMWKILIEEWSKQVELAVARAVAAVPPDITNPKEERDKAFSLLDKYLSKAVREAINGRD